MKKITVLPFALFYLILISGAHTVQACSCSGTPTACESFASADAVFIGGVTKTLDAGMNGLGQNHSYVTVQKVFKGKVPKQVRFVWGGTSCDVWMEAGQKWLLYASRLNKAGTLWYIGGCGRSRQVRPGMSDLKYLESEYKGKQVNRLSVNLSYSSGLPIANAEIEIEGNGEKQKLLTDEFGRFETYNLSPGIYKVGPMATGSWNGFLSQDGRSSLELRPELFNPLTDRLSVEVTKDSCSETGLRLGTGNYIKGSIVSNDGKPVTGICVDALFLDRAKKITGETTDCVNERGDFLFSEVPTGKYLLRARTTLLNRPWAPHRFPDIYFPSTFYQATAVAVTVTEEDSPDVRIIFPGNHPHRTFDGKVTFSDGSPADGSRVLFEFYDGPEIRTIETTADQKGKFRLSLVAGLRGKLYAEGQLWSYEGDECQKLRRHIPKGEDYSFVRVPSKRIPLRVTYARSDLILKLPYSKCADAK